MSAICRLTMTTTPDHGMTHGRQSARSGSATVPSDIFFGVRYEIPSSAKRKRGVRANLFDAMSNYVKTKSKHKYKDRACHKSIGKPKELRGLVQPFDPQRPRHHLLRDRTNPTIKINSQSMKQTNKKEGNGLTSLSFSNLTPTQRRPAGRSQLFGSMANWTMIGSVCVARARVDVMIG